MRDPFCAVSTADLGRARCAFFFFFFSECHKPFSGLGKCFYTRGWGTSRRLLRWCPLARRTFLSVVPARSLSGRRREPAVSYGGLDGRAR